MAVKDLINAIHYGKEDEVTAAIESGEINDVSVNVPIGEGRFAGQTPLCVAINYDEPEIVNLLIDAGANVNAIVASIFTDDDRGWETILNLAIRCDEPEIVESLIKAGAEVNATTISEGHFAGEPPLCVAINKGNLEIIQSLIDAGANVNATISEGRFAGQTPLCVAINKGDLEIIQLLIYADANVNTTISEGHFAGDPPLCVAINKGNLKIIQSLIDAGANVNSTISEGHFAGQTPLDVAIRCNNIDIVNLFFEKRTDVNLKKLITNACKFDDYSCNYYFDFFNQCLDSTPPTLSIASVAKIILDPPSSMLLRKILAQISAEEDFTQTSAWLLLNKIAESEEGKELSKLMTARAIVTWQESTEHYYAWHQDISVGVMQAAVSLFKLEEKITSQANTKIDYNPLLIEVGYTMRAASPSAVFDYYIKNYEQYQNITIPESVVHKLLLLRYIIKNAPTIANEDYREDIVDYWAAYMLKLLDNIPFSNINTLELLEIALKDAVFNFVADNIVEKEGFVLTTQPSYSDYRELLIKLSIADNPLEAAIAANIKIKLLLNNQETNLDPSQSAHDKTKARHFDAFSERYAALQNYKQASLTINPEHRVTYLCLYALYTLYDLNPESDGLAKILKDDLHFMALYTKSKDFAEFFENYTKMPEKSPTLEYVLNGTNESRMDGKKIIAIDGAIALIPDNYYAQQAARVLRVVRSTTNNSFFITDKEVLQGTVNMIQYINSPSDFWKQLVNSHEDVMTLTQRLGDNFQKEIEALTEIYEQHHNADFSLDIYQSILQRVFEERLKFDQENILLYIGEAVAAYGENSQSCETGCKSRLDTILIGDMLFGQETSRFDLIEKCLGKLMEEKFKEKIKSLTDPNDPKAIRKLLSAYLSVRLDNADMFIKNPNNPVNNYVPTHGEDLEIDVENIKPLCELFDMSEKELQTKVAIAFNNNPKYNWKGEQGELTHDELRIIGLLVHINGGEQQQQRLAELFKTLYPLEMLEKTKSASSETGIFSILKGEILAINSSAMKERRIKQLKTKVADIINPNESNDESLQTKVDNILNAVLAVAKEDPNKLDAMLKLLDTGEFDAVIGSHANLTNLKTPKN